MAYDAPTQQFIQSWWAAYNQAHPSLFNGPLVACHTLRMHKDGQLDIEWYATTYAHYLLRADSAVGLKPARAIYCSVALATANGRVVVCQMAQTTAAPNRLQLPGGNVEVGTGRTLTLANCAEDACRELAEEIGIELSQSELALWRVKVGGKFDDVGLIFKNRSAISEGFVSGAFEKHLTALKNQGVDSEIASLRFLSGCDEVGEEDCVDYLSDVLDEMTLTIRSEAAL